jgi:hypothetical protein
MSARGAGNLQEQMFPHLSEILLVIYVPNDSTERSNFQFTTSEHFHRNDRLIHPLVADATNVIFQNSISIRIYVRNKNTSRLVIFVLQF